jgi:putative cell wall-binding protein
MDKNSLKKIIKPLIKECLTEILYEQGLSRLIEESIKLKSNEMVKESKREENYEIKEQRFLKQASQSVNSQKSKLQEAKKHLLEKIAMNGFDPFAGSTPINNSEHQITESINPQMSVHPGLSNGGVDISGLIGKNKQIWKGLSNALNGKKE